MNASERDLGNAWKGITAMGAIPRITPIMIHIIPLPRARFLLARSSLCWSGLTDQTQACVQLPSHHRILIPVYRSNESTSTQIPSLTWSCRNPIGIEWSPFQTASLLASAKRMATRGFHFL
jgi:hypothetical protein